MLSPISKRLVVAVSGVAAALLLASCGAPAPTASPSGGTSASTTPSPSASASGTVTPSATPTPTTPAVPASTNLDGIKVTGTFGKVPTVSFKHPLRFDKTQSKVLIAGTGPVVQSDGVVDVHYVGYVGRTGTKFNDSYAQGATVAFPLGNVVPGFKKGLEGKKVGDRVLIAMTSEDGYAQGNPQIGVNIGDTLIFVVDIRQTSLKLATGTAVTPPATVPAYKVTGNKPEVSITTTATPPTALVAQPLIKGTGTVKVEKNSFILAKYRTYSWKTGKLIEDKYGDQPDYGAIADTIPAWQKGLIGQTVGSRVMIIAPPADAYPNGNTNPPVEKGDTLVYVVDVLWAHPQNLAG